MLTKRRVRLLLLAMVLLATVGVAHGWATRPARGEAPGADDVTVVTAQGREYLVDTGRMVAFGRDGSIIAEHREYNTYFDVDPVEGEEMVVEYAAADYLPAAECPENIETRRCTRQLVLRTDLRTEETTVVWDTYWPKFHKLHDFDRVNDTHIVVADIYRDWVYYVNVSSGERTWTWKARDSYEYGEVGGTGREGFTHVNDVELVRDGQVMVTLRNLDRTVFLDPGEGVVRDWTLGCEDCHDVLFEHHNSDYMPATDDTPPTVIVADSENDRIVEYRRVDGEWRLSWTYTNAGMHWPRDADRLPDGHTLVTDSNSNRVYEIDRQGEVVWQTTIGNPYEAERLGTGDESSALPHEPSTQVVAERPVDAMLLAVRDVLPSKLLSGALFLAPYWAGLGDLLLWAAGALALVALAGLETTWWVRRRWRADGPVVPRPARLRERSVDPPDRDD